MGRTGYLRGASRLTHRGMPGQSVHGTTVKPIIEPESAGTLSQGVLADISCNFLRGFCRACTICIASSLPAGSTGRLQKRSVYGILSDIAMTAPAFRRGRGLPASLRGRAGSSPREPIYTSPGNPYHHRGRASATVRIAGEKNTRTDTDEVSG